MFSFDNAFHKNINPVPKDCPCRECDESKRMLNNPYYISTKCDQCEEYYQWVEGEANNDDLSKIY